MRVMRKTPRANRAPCVIIERSTPAHVVREGASASAPHADLIGSHQRETRVRGGYVPPHPSRRLLAIADDLSGAAETAAGLLSRTTRSRVLLVHPVTLRQELTDVPAAPGEATVLDLDSRYLPPAPAADRVRAALAAVAPDTPVLAKIDSLLRGNTAATAATLAEAGAPVLAAPALPAAGRTVRAGVVHLGDTPLHLTDAWRVEATAPPRSLAEAFAPLPVELIDLATVRAPRTRLAAALAAATAAGRLAACDA
ncbi:hypothetical protein E1265_16255, partial [Streptomyces sp. 8K308]